MSSFISQNRKRICDSIIPSLLISLFVVVGFSTKKYNGVRVNLGMVGMLIILFFVCSIALSLLYVYFDGRNAQRTETIPVINNWIGKSYVYYFVTFILIMALWVPTLLSLYPGLYCYDASWQYEMFVKGLVTEHHPVVHTYLLGFLIDTVYTLTGSFNKGILAYTLFQMMLMAGGCAYVLYLFHRRKSPIWMHVFGLLFFTLYPPFVIFVFTATKDSIFAIAVADFVYLNLFLIEDKRAFFEKRSNIVQWIVLALAVCILRNNAIYAIVLTLPFFIYMIAKSSCNKKKAVMMLLITVAIYIIYKHPISKAVTVGGTSETEMLSVPCQQVMRVYKYHYDELPSEYTDEVERFFDDKAWYGYYVPEIADATKGSLRKNLYESEKKEFFSLWLNLFKLYPKEYVDSFLENTYGFYYPWPHYIIYSFGDEGYTPIVVMQPGELNSKLPGLLSFYKQFENGPIVQKMPFISWLFAPATFMYIALIMSFYMGGSIKKGYSIQFIFLGLLWLTYLLGPVAMVRYALYLYALVPVWPACLLSKRESKDGI